VKKALEHIRKTGQDKETIAYVYVVDENNYLLDDIRLRKLILTAPQKKMKDIINEYIIELGREGLIVRMRMREITQGIDKVRDLIFRDYLPKSKKIEQFFDNLSFDKLLDLKNIASNLFKKSLETLVNPKGYRILSKTSLNKDEIEVLIRHFKNFDSILSGDEESLKKILSNPKKFQKEINVLREHVMLGKKV